jgi:uncharacterized NAD(P)/FAD-binding protein YdhS
MARRTVAVIGGGCAGVLVTRQLLRCSDDDPIIIEPDILGGGPAYGPAQPWHLLNSRAGAMSADPDDPQHFVRWARSVGIAAEPTDFLPRREFGRYLRAALAEAVAETGDRLTHHRTRVARVLPDGVGCTVELADGHRIRADHAVLATGGAAAARPAVVPVDLQDHPGYVGDPWRPDALAAVPSRAPVLLIGTGLTAIDVALTLTSGERAGRGAPLIAVSRHGQVPQAHVACPSSPIVPSLGAGPAGAGPAGVGPAGVGPAGVRSVGVGSVGVGPGGVAAFGEELVGAGSPGLRALVRAVRDRAGRGEQWRTVVDGLRPYLDGIWTSLAHDEQEAFLRHLARFWESHRHRMAPSVAARVADLRADGVLDVRTGGVRSIAAAAGGGFDVVLADGGAQWFAAVVNCAGPGRLPGSAGPLIGGLLEAGAARVGPHGLGLAVDAAGRVIDATGAVQQRLWVLGPLRRGVQWETTAVPELRAQAAALVARLAATGTSVRRAQRDRRLGGRRWDAA